MIYLLYGNNQCLVYIPAAAKCVWVHVKRFAVLSGRRLFLINYECFKCWPHRVEFDTPDLKSHSNVAININTFHASVMTFISPLGFGFLVLRSLGSRDDSTSSFWSNAASFCPRWWFHESPPDSQPGPAASNTCAAPSASLSLPTCTALLFTQPRG